MNESIKNMIERRSVRGYKPDMIPKEDLEKLFQKFYRVEQSRSQNTGVTGYCCRYRQSHPRSAFQNECGCHGN